MSEWLKDATNYVQSRVGGIMSNSNQQENREQENHEHENYEQEDQTAQAGYDPLEERERVYDLLGDLGQAMSSEEVQQAIQDGEIDYDHAVEMVDDLEQYVEKITHYQRVMEELEEKEWEQYGQDMHEIRSRLEDRLEDIQQYQSGEEAEESEQQVQQFVDDLQGVRDALRDARPSDQRIQEKEQRLDRINSILEE